MTDTHPPPVPKRAKTGVDVIDAIYDRRAVRTYSSRPVTESVVRALIDAAIQAPSAVNQQPWAFVVIQDRELLARLSQRSKVLTLGGIRADSPERQMRAILEAPAFDVFYGGSTLICVCAAHRSTWPANEDACLAAQNLMLAAHGMGLGTCPVGFARGALNEPAMKSELRISDEFDVILPLLVGYPEGPRTSNVPRDAARILSWKGMAR